MRVVTEFLPRLAIIALIVISLVYESLPVARHFAGIVAIESMSPATPLDLPANDQPNLERLLQTAPFGRVAQADVPASPRSGETPNILLRGVFYSAQSISAAFLEVDGTVGLFREEQTVTPSFVLADVGTDHVKLTAESETLTLYLDDDAQTLEKSDSKETTTDGQQDLLARMGSGVVVPATYQKPGPPETTSEYIDYWRNRIRKNPNAVLKDIGLKATEQGYVIAEQHDIGVKLAGLKSGDLVRSVNGQAVGNPESDRRFYDQIAASGHARLEVERNGRILTFSFPLR